VSDQLDQPAVDRIAAALASRVGAVGAGSLRERRDLEPGAVDGLREVFGDRVAKSRRVRIPQWESVGNVDVVVLVGDEPDVFSVLAELKWCGAKQNVLYEGIWDLFKMALATMRPEHPRAYLISGADESVWQTSPFFDLFENREHNPIELCMRDLGGRDHWLAWDALLYGGYDRHPDAVPAVLGTTVVGRAAVGDAELRAVEVSIASDGLIPFVAGWPYGDRPTQAHRPELAPATRFTDTDDDIQWDPATDPANKELIAELKRIGAWYGDPDDEDNHSEK